ncbi:MAG TPA: hypothetical protein VGK59_15760 [Ohtaekwangia sp.]
MKTASALLTIVTMTMSSFTVKYSETSEKMAQDVVSAFQHNSPQEFVTLFPTLQEFHQLMDETSALYGDFLPEAKKEFASEYENELLPEVREAFQHILIEGKKKGIDWSAIEYIRTEVGKISSAKSASVTVFFQANGKEHSLRIENAMTIHEQWKVSQYLDLK